MDLSARKRNERVNDRSFSNVILCGLTVLVAAASLGQYSGVSLGYYAKTQQTRPRSVTFSVPSNIDQSADHPASYFFELGTSHDTNKQIPSEKDFGDSCLPKEEWHSLHFVNCNTFHEIDHASSVIDDSIGYLAQGATRSTWLLEHHSLEQYQQSKEKLALKTLNWSGKEFIKSTYEHQRIDALISERLTASPLIIDTYGFCGMSTLNEFGEGGRFGQHFLSHNHTSNEKLTYALDIARGLAHVHGIGLHSHGTDNRPTVVHHDFSPKNLLLTADYRVKISDFNNAHLMRFHKEKQRSCYEFHWDFLCGTTVERTNRRSPEECLVGLHRSEGKAKSKRRNVWRTNERTEVWHLGTILHFLLTEEHYPYQSEKQGYMPSTENVREMILNGTQAPLPPDIEHSSDPAISVIVEAMRKAFTYDMRRRPSAKAIANILMKQRDLLRFG